MRALHGIVRKLQWLLADATAAGDVAMKHILGIAALATALGWPALSWSQAEVFDQFYRMPDPRTQVGQVSAPGEQIDLFTGTLRLTHVDLELPGRAGMDLAIVRSYSSKVWQRKDAVGPTGGQLLLADIERSTQTMGLGWSVHMGRLREPERIIVRDRCADAVFPTYEAPDGSTRVFYPFDGTVSDPHLFVSRDFWRLNTKCTLDGQPNGPPGACITTSQGQHIRFDKSLAFFVNGTSPVWPATRISDETDLDTNAIKVEYQGRTGVVDKITDTVGRIVDFRYEACGAVANCLKSVTAIGLDGTVRKVDYEYRTLTGSDPINGPGQQSFATAVGGRALLTKVLPAIGPGYSYEYGYERKVVENQYALKAIVHPSGGRTEFTYKLASFLTGRERGEAIELPVVATRTVNGRDLEAGVWRYNFTSAASDPLQTATVTRPDGRDDVYRYQGFGSLATVMEPGSVWRIGLLREKTLGRTVDGSSQHSESYDWDKGEKIVSRTVYAAPSYFSDVSCLQWSYDPAVYAPVLVSSKITRDKSEYTSTFSEHDDFGQPKKVVEKGERSRTMRYDYDHGEPDSNLLLGRVSYEQVCENVDGATSCVETKRTFKGAPGSKLDSVEARGVKTCFSYNPADGALNKITKAGAGSCASASGVNLRLSDYDGGSPRLVEWRSADNSVVFDRSQQILGDGKVRSQTDARNNRTEFGYDTAGRLELVTPPGSSDQMQYKYAADGSSYTVQNLERGSTAPYFAIKSTLDGFGRVVRQENTLRFPTAQTYEYDAQGQVRFQSYPFKVGETVYGDRMEYDGIGRVVKTQRRYDQTAGRCRLADGCTEVSAVYGEEHCTTLKRQRAANDDLLRAECMESYGDPAHERLRTLSEGNGGSWRYEYTVDGQLRRLHQPRAQPDEHFLGGDRWFEYESGTLRLLTDRSGPRGTTTAKEYTALGQIRRSVDANGATTEYIYDDPLARLSDVRNGSDPSSVKRSYDRDKIHSVGSAQGGTYTYGYDEIGRVTQRTWTFGRDFVTKYKYDSHGCLDTVTYPTGTVLAIGCDAKGRAIELRLGSSAGLILAKDIEYAANGGIAHMASGSGTTLDRSFKKNRLVRVAAPPYVDLSYAYDGVDNVTTITDGIDGSASVSLLEYDAQNRLWKHAGREYKYSDVGNLLTETYGNGASTIEYRYNDATGRLTSMRGAGMPQGKLDWSPDGSPRAFSASGCNAVCLLMRWLGSPTVPLYASATTKYESDAFTRRVLKSVPLPTVVGQDPRYETTLYHYDESGLLLAETDREGNSLREYYYAADLMFAGKECLRGAPEICNKVWFVTDRLGSVVARQVEGMGLERTLYEPFGRKAAGGAKSFLAHPFDEETQLYDLGSRLYSPDLRRFVSADRGPLIPGDPQRSNAYSYARNNPLHYTDVDGRSPTIPLAVAGAIIGGTWAAYAYRDLNGADYAAEVLKGAAIGGLIGLTAGVAYEVGAGAYATYTVAGGGAKGVGVAVAIHGTEVAAALVPEAGLAGNLLAADERAAAAAVEGQAAKGGGELTRVGRWMSEPEFSQMSATGRVIEGAGGRTSVLRPPDPAAFKPPPSSTIYAEFDVPSGVLRGGGKPNWAIIPGPNVQTRIFGPAPTSMPPATCIDCVIKK